MKSLMLLRHGKSNWDVDYAGDHERPLAPRGVKAARDIGAFLTTIDFVPDLVLSSTAVRARTTFERAKESGEWACQSELKPELYEANSQSVLYLCSEIDDSFERVLLVGHEPTWSHTVSVLTGANVRYPTACLTRIDLMINNWSNIRQGSGELQWFLPPRLLAAF